MDNDLIAALASVNASKKVRKTKQLSGTARKAEEFRNMSWSERFRYHSKMAWITIAISTIIAVSIVFALFL